MTRLKRIASLVTIAPDCGELPYVALEHVGSGTGRLATDALPLRPRPESGAATCLPGDVLVGKLRPYLNKTLRVETEMYASTELMCLRPGPHTDSRWLSYLVSSVPTVEWAVASSDGSKMPRTSWEKLGELSVSQPHPARQQAIADYLDTETARIDALLAKKRQMGDLLLARRGALIETEIRRLASEQGERRLRFVAPEILVGIVITPAAYYADSGVLALRGINVKPGRLDLSDVVTITDEGHALHRKSTLHEGDLVVVRTGQAGAACVVPPELDGINCIDVLIVRRSAALDPWFLEYVINSDWTARHIEEHSVGTIQSHFNVGALKELPVPVPPLAVQRETSSKLRAVVAELDSMRSSLDRQIDLLIEHRQALITAAVTGELEIPGVAA